MDEDDHRSAEERTSPSGEVVHAAVVGEGEHELQRASAALVWSALAAGLAMSFSFLGTALVHAHTPDAKWQPLVTALGYPLGFLIVVLGRQQLFTENTVTAVLPYLEHRRPGMVGNVARVWSLVLLGNILGALAMAMVFAKTEAVSHETFESMRKIAEHAYENRFAVTMLRAIFSGWLIALMVWLLPYAQSARVAVIAVLTYTIGVAHFPHVIAGTVDAAFLVFLGDRTWGELMLAFFIPTLIGNILGGTVLVAALNHVQVKAGKRSRT